VGVALGFSETASTTVGVALGFSETASTTVGVALGFSEAASTTVGVALGFSETPVTMVLHYSPGFIATQYFVEGYAAFLVFGTVDLLYQFFIKAGAVFLIKHPKRTGHVFYIRKAG